MAKPKRNENSVTIEELLSLKKHEQPDEAFWATFEERLHKKTLQTLVTRKSWLTRLRNRLSSAAHPAFAMPAAAALAFGIFVMSPVDQSSPENAIGEMAATAPETSADTQQYVMASFPSDDVDTHFAANTMASDYDNAENYTKLRANQSLTTNHENVTYAASTYTTAQYSYAALPANTLY